MYFLIKDDKKAITLITLMHDNTPHFLFFIFFVEILRGGGLVPLLLTPMAPPLSSVM